MDAPPTPTAGPPRRRRRQGHARLTRRAGVAALALAGAVALGGLQPSGAGAAPSGDPVDAALARPGALDSLAEVRDLADDTTGRRGTTVGVITDTNGSEPGGVAVERIVAAPDDVAALTTRLDAVDGVFSAAPEQRVAVTADPLEGAQYGPTRIGARSIDPGADGRGTTVAVVDTGVAAGHPDLTLPLPDGRPRIASGRTFLLGDGGNGGPGNVDPHGHGTHVAGIIDAARGDGVGGSGVAPGAQVLPVRVLSAGGTGWSSDVAAGILWAHQQGADVINLSLGAGGAMPFDVALAIQFATTDTSRGKAPTIVVAAAGNDGPASQPQWPGSHERAIAVAATTSSDAVASFSSRGSYVDVAAPGESILSTCRTGGWCVMSGTSMATPMVAGAAAVLRQLDPSRGPDQVRARLEGTAVDIATPGRDTASGAGRVDLAAAVRGGPEPAPPPPPPPTPATGSVDVARGDRRRVAMSGSAVDPDGTVLVRIIATSRGRTEVHDTWAPGGAWSAEWDQASGTVDACAVAVDQPTGEGVLLGCRQIVVK